MQSKNFPFGIRENPITKSLYEQRSEDGDINPPGPSEVRWTDSGIDRITDNGIDRITD